MAQETQACSVSYGSLFSCENERSRFLGFGILTGKALIIRSMSELQAIEDADDPDPIAYHLA